MNDTEKRLDRTILHGLVCEWETALWILSPEHRKRMRRPLFTLKDMNARVGSWCPVKREIMLSRHLTRHHSWDAVKEVLLHEIAHQFTDEVLHGTSEKPHGPNFRRACHLLRANPKASGYYVPLDVMLDQNKDFQEEGPVARIRKLLALGHSSNLHEAEAAIAKAHQLMERHQFSHIQDRPQKDFVSAFLGKPRLRHRREEYCLANLLQDFYFIQGIWIPAYVIEKGKMGRVLEVSGTKQNVQMSRYVYDFITRYVKNQWAVYNQDKKLVHHRKTDFAIGILEGFRTTIESKKKNGGKNKEEKALMQVQDALLTEYVSYRYPQTVSFKKNTSQHCAQVYSDGVACGKQLHIAKGIDHKDTADLLLLE